jgi:hypothetical protein
MPTAPASISCSTTGQYGASTTSSPAPESLGDPLSEGDPVSLGVPVSPPLPEPLSAGEPVSDPPVLESAGFEPGEEEELEQAGARRAEAIVVPARASAKILLMMAVSRRRAYLPLAPRSMTVS